MSFNRKETPKMKRVKHLVILATILNICTCIQGGEYQCPQECVCTQVPRGLFVVNIECKLSSIDTHSDFSALPTNLKSNLTIICDRTRKSHLYDHMFNVLHEFVAITFKNCAFSFIPQNAFTGMTSLQQIAIENAKDLEIHPDALGDVKKLSRLSITGSELTKAPNLCGNTYLIEIDFSENNIQSLNDIGLNCKESIIMTSLRILTLSFNKISIFEQKLGEVAPYLENLRFSDGLITNLHPESLWNLTQLLWLDLSNNNIHNIPPYLLRHQANLQVVGLSKNPLNSLPQGVFGYSGKLKMVALGNTGRDNSVWQEFYPLQQLVEIQLQDNIISRLDINMLDRLGQLKYIDLSGNIISSVESDTFVQQSKLTTLILSRNKITRFEYSSMKGLVSLNHLDVSQNILSTFPSSEFESMENLNHFNISNNKLNAVPDLKYLQNLVVVDVHSNNVTALTSTTFDVQSLTQINLSYNKIRRIPRNVFNEPQSLKVLDMSNNIIESIEQNAFWGCGRLEVLNLNSNHIKEISAHFIDISSLKILELQGNELSGSVYDGLFPNSISNLNLSENNITSMDPYALYKLKHIQYIDVRNNNIKTMRSLSLEVSPSTKMLRPQILVSGNPLVCDCELKWLREMGISLKPGFSKPAKIMDFNEIECYSDFHASLTKLKDLDPDAMLCSYDLECVQSTCMCCDYEGCVCRWTCPEGCSCFRSNDHKTVNYVMCNSNNLTSIPVHLPNIATDLWFENNQLHSIEKHSFLGVESAKVLFLNNSGIESIENASFVGLHQLVSLYLQANHISELLYGMLNGLDNVREINLEDNELSVIDYNVFVDTPALQKLYLANNRLVRIPDSVFYITRHAAQLSLSGNPWSCDCEFWTGLVHNVNILGRNVTDRDYIECTKQLRNGSEIDMYASESETSTACPELELLITDNIPKPVKESIHKEYDLTMFIAIVAGIICIVILFGILFWQKNFFAIFCFSNFGVRLHSQPEEINKLYDAFISYSEKDEDFVNHQLVRKLEEMPRNYKTQRLLQRDPVDNDFTAVFSSCVNKSRRTIVVVSKNFLEHEWRQHEYQSAHHSELQRKKSTLILLFLDKTNKVKIDQGLRYLAKNSTCIYQSDNLFWDKLFYSMPSCSLRKKLISPDVVTFTNAAHRYDEGYETPVSHLSIARSPSDDIGNMNSLNQLHIYEEVHPVSQYPCKMHDKSNTQHTFKSHYDSRNTQISFKPHYDSCNTQPSFKTHYDSSNTQSPLKQHCNSSNTLHSLKSHCDSSNTQQNYPPHRTMDSTVAYKTSACLWS